MKTLIRPHVDSRLCFVLMPFREPFNRYYKTLLKHTIELEGFKCIRADGIYGQQVMGDIWDSIWRAKVVIADVTSKNPNVNYELGLCHALGIPTVIITQSRSHVPFDYRYRRHILYQPTKPGWRKRLQTELINYIKTALNNPSSRDRMLLWPEGVKIRRRALKPVKVARPQKRSVLLDFPRVPFKHKQDADFIKEQISRRSKDFRLKITLPQETYWRCGFVLAPEDYIHEGRSDVTITKYFLFHIGQGVATNPKEVTGLRFQAYHNDHRIEPRAFHSESLVEVEVRFSADRRHVAISLGGAHYETDLEPTYFRYLYILAWADWFGPFRVPAELMLL